MSQDTQGAVLRIADGEAVTWQGKTAKVGAPGKVLRAIVLPNTRKVYCYLVETDYGVAYPLGAALETQNPDARRVPLFPVNGASQEVEHGG